MTRIRLALVGLGKIARDQHIPALTASDEFDLVAAASPGEDLSGLATFPDVHALLRTGPQLAAVAVCTPPQVRYEIARAALEHGLHVLLEKPPAMTVGQVEELVSLAQHRSVALFAAWHSRHARGVEVARAWLDGRRISAIRVTWKEDVRVWHPGQKWIWQAGGMGVFDPGINALSILTRIVPGRWVVEDAELSFPQNCATPIAARLWLGCTPTCSAQVALDFRQTGVQTWDIDVVTDAGRLVVSEGGARVCVDGLPIETPDKAEYPDLYGRFAQLVRGRSIDVDVSPLKLVDDALARGRRVTVEPFADA